MNAAKVSRMFSEIRVFQSGSLRALHKPLVLLYALARCSRREERLVCFGDVEEALKQLLQAYFPSRNPRPQYPFWRLQSDGLWEFNETGVYPLNADPPVSYLRDTNRLAGFPVEIHQLLLKNNGLVHSLSAQLLDKYFPSSIHEDLLDAVGMMFTSIGRASRDPRFRGEVLRAYRSTCGVCGYDGRLQHAPMGIEAAHIKWHQVGGPDIVPNGIAMCSLHHKMFDLGAFTVLEDRTIVVSEEVSGGPRADGLLRIFHRRKLAEAQRSEYYPGKQFVEWHRKERFREPGLPV